MYIKHVKYISVPIYSIEETRQNQACLLKKETHFLVLCVNSFSSQSQRVILSTNKNIIRSEIFSKFNNF